MSKKAQARSTFGLIITVAAALGVVEAAAAASRVTPPFSVPTGGFALCTAVNLSTAPRTITIEMRDSAGNLVPFANANCSAANPKSVTVDAGAVSPIACDGTGYRYCRFTISGAGKSSLRAMLRVTDGSNTPIAVLPAE